MDSSGFVLKYTPQLRANNLGVLTVGSTGMQIPPDNDTYVDAPNICPAECTGKRVLAPVTLVSNFYVMGSLVRRLGSGREVVPRRVMQFRISAGAWAISGLYGRQTQRRFQGDMHSGNRA